MLSFPIKIVISADGMDSVSNIVEKINSIKEANPKTVFDITIEIDLKKLSVF